MGQVAGRRATRGGCSGAVGGPFSGLGLVRARAMSRTSVPVLQKKALSAKEFSTSRLASATCGCGRERPEASRGSGEHTGAIPEAWCGHGLAAGRSRETGELHACSKECGKLPPRPARHSREERASQLDGWAGHTWRRRGRGCWWPSWRMCASCAGLIACARLQLSQGAPHRHGCPHEALAAGRRQTVQPAAPSSSAVVAGCTLQAGGHRVLATASAEQPARGESATTDRALLRACAVTWVWYRLLV
jgi:hypothetical protein